MSKTVFTDGNPELEILGTPIMAAFLNAIFHTAGGHVHDGGDEDGHAPLISFPNLGGMDAGFSQPTEGTWPKGWIRWNTLPVAGENIGWVCIVAGTPGTWHAFGVISDNPST